MRRAALPLSFAAVAFVLNGSAGASCAQTQPDAVAVAPATAAAGASVSVDARGSFGSPCNDQGGSGTACGITVDRIEPQPPSQTSLRFVAGDRSWSLGEITEREPGVRRRDIAVPKDAAPGVGELQVLSESGRILAVTPLTITP